MHLVVDELSVKAEPWTDDVAMRYQCRNHRFGQIDRNSKSDVLRARDDGGCDPDHFAAAVQQWATGVSRIDRRVNLDQRLLKCKKGGRKDTIRRGHGAAGQCLS